MNKAYFFLSLLLIISCKQSESTSQTLIKGKVENPRADFLLLYELPKFILIDSLKLDAKNEFKFESKDFKSNYYMIFDNNEMQRMYINNGDQITINMDASRMDESLIFSGKGAEKNEFLIYAYREYNKILSKRKSILNLEEEDFVNYTDSLLLNLTEKMQYIEKVESDYSEHLNNTLNILGKIKFFNLKELYIKDKLKKDSTYKVNPKLINHRELVSLSDTTFHQYTVYHYYIYNYFNNISYEPGLSFRKTNTKILKLIRDKLKDSYLQNALSSDIIRTEFYYDKTFTVDPENYRIFKQASDPKLTKEDIVSLVDTKNKIANNSKMIDIALEKPGKDPIKLSSLYTSDFNIVIFWESRLLDEEYLLSLINKLQKKYPKTRFITLDLYNSKENVGIMEKLNYQDYYMIKDLDALKPFVNLKNHRTLILDNKGVVINNFTDIKSTNFEDQLYDIYTRNIEFKKTPLF